MGVAARLQTRIREVLGSNIDRDILRALFVVF
jgi:hypothetical protein